MAAYPSLFFSVAAEAANARRVVVKMYDPSTGTQLTGQYAYEAWATISGAISPAAGGMELSQSSGHRLNQYGIRHILGLTPSSGTAVVVCGYAFTGSWLLRVGMRGGVYGATWVSFVT